MRRTPAISHLIDRIQEIAESQNIDAIARDTQPIVRHILDRFPRLNVEEREALEQLRTLPWLPGSLNGERVQGKRFAPSLVYRSFRSPGFLSQRMVRSEEHTSELQSLMRISYAVFCLKNKTYQIST